MHNKDEFSFGVAQKGNRAEKRQKMKKKKNLLIPVHVHVFDFVKSCGVRGRRKYFDISYEYHQMNWQIDEIISKSKKSTVLSQSIEFYLKLLTFGIACT